MSAEPLAESLADRVRRGDARAIARAISLIEDETPGAVDLIRTLYPFTGKAYIVGVTGPPGAGKSTLVDRLTSEIRRGGQSVGVIAVDPTSPFTGGAVLGDRVRMSGHAADSGVFIRSMATRGYLGGLARATSDAALVLDAAGTDIVIIETVGVGQGEIDIVRAADVSIVTLVPGTGDDVQALKAGIMEIADIFVVNKADHEGANRLVQSITAALSLHEAAEGAWRPPVLKTIATDGSGVAELWTAVSTFRQRESAGRLERERTRQEHRLRDVLTHAYLRDMERRLPPGEWQRLVAAIVQRTTDPYTAADAVRRQLDTTPDRQPAQ